MYYWWTHHGAEVDLLICRGNEILCAVERKSSRNIVKEGLDGIASFHADHPTTPVFVLGDGQTRRLLAEDLTVMNWDDFLRDILPSL